jgi:hypothetical protein
MGGRTGGVSPRARARAASKWGSTDDERDTWVGAMVDGAMVDGADGGKGAYDGGVEA